MLQKASVRPEFKFYTRAAAINLTPLVFADDILLFSYGDVDFVLAIMNGVDHFSKISGLCPKPNKCTCFFSSMPLDQIQQILATTKISWGELPTRYLGDLFSPPS